MPARKATTRLTDDWRSKIKTSMLLNRLGDNALADGDIMTAGQIKSAEILLRKVIPDLKAIELTGAEGGPVQVAVEVVFVEPNATT